MVDSVLTSDFRSFDANATLDATAHRACQPDVWFEITNRMSRGDREAFREYYDQFYGLMLVESKRCTGRDEQTCLDIVHDAMLKAIRSMKPIANQRSLKTWSRLLVKSVSYDWLRREQRQRTLNRESEQIAEERNDREHGTTQHFDDQARILWIEQNLGKFPLDLQRMFAWRYRFGWTLRRIGQRMGLKPGAVDGKLRRAIEDLRNLAEREYDE